MTSPKVPYVCIFFSKKSKLTMLIKKKRRNYELCKKNTVYFLYNKHQMFVIHKKTFIKKRYPNNMTFIKLYLFVFKKYCIYNDPCNILKKTCLLSKKMQLQLSYLIL